MQVVKKEKDEIVQTLREALLDLKGAHDKLRRIIDEKQLEHADAAMAVVYATDSIECAAAFLTMEQEESIDMILRVSPPDSAWEQVPDGANVIQLEYERFTIL